MRKDHAVRLDSVHSVESSESAARGERGRRREQREMKLSIDEIATSIFDILGASIFSIEDPEILHEKLLRFLKNTSMPCWNARSSPCDR